jgi:hypothetical protein
MRVQRSVLWGFLCALSPFRIGVCPYEVKRTAIQRATRGMCPSFTSSFTSSLLLIESRATRVKLKKIESPPALRLFLALVSSRRIESTPPYITVLRVAGDTPPPSSPFAVASRVSPRPRTRSFRFLLLSLILCFLLLSFLGSRLSLPSDLP